MEKIETYFKTENEHWNEHVFNLYNKAISSGLFPDVKLPIEMFDKGTQTILNSQKSSVKGANELLKELECFDVQQQLFMLDKIADYFKHTEFDGVELSEAQVLLKSYIKKLQPKKPIAGNLREILKAFVMDELESLPETVKELEPLQRLNIVAKLIPFVMPRVESVHFERGEGNGFAFDY